MELKKLALQNDYPGEKVGFMTVFTSGTVLRQL